MSQAEISAAEQGADGILVHTVQSEYQSGMTKIRVLLPDALTAGQRLPVLFVLPVEHLDHTRQGDGLAELRKLGIHNRGAGVVCVYPTFSQWPFYGDHATNPQARQESHLLQAVLPFVASQYPVVPEVAGRLLLGFGKSGWGAVSLLLRHPELFGKAAAWDAPLVIREASVETEVGAGEGTRPLATEHDLLRLLKMNTFRFRDRPPRLVLGGWCQYQAELRRVQAALDVLRLPYQIAQIACEGSRWDSGWLAQTADLLLTTG